MLPERSTPAVPALRETPSASSARDFDALQGCRVLVVDDSVDSAESLAMFLDLSGCETRIAADGVEAVAAAAAFRPQAVLLDLGLPKMDGYGACRAIRGEEWGHGIVVLALTGWSQDKDRQRSRDAGFDHHLVKPVDPSLLIRVLNDELLSRGSLS